MNFHDYYLWAGLTLICLSLGHFLRQRRCFDRSTVLFLQLMVLAGRCAFWAS